jgi:hypothetical protein
MCNLGDATIELDNPGRFRLRLASHSDVRALETKVTLPPNTLAIVSGEQE